MAAGTYEWQSDFARKYVGQGREEGLAEGKAKGKVEGKAEGEAEAVIAVLEARGVPVTDQDEARIRKCTDLDQLDTWLQRAVTAETAGDVFG